MTSAPDDAARRAWASPHRDGHLTAHLDRFADARQRAHLLSELLRDGDTRVLDTADDTVPLLLPGQDRAARHAATPDDPGAAARAAEFTPAAVLTGATADGPPTTGGIRLRTRPPRPNGPHRDEDARAAFLGRSADGTAYVLMRHPTSQRAHAALDDPSATWVGLRDCGAWLDPLDLELALTALGLARWHATHRHCPRCGAPTHSAHAGWVRRCSRDGTMHFPRTDPAVIMSVIDPDDRLLLGRGATFKTGRVSVLAGFVEPGERLEDAVAREVAEEVGLVIDRVDYVGSQPWPFPASLMVGFEARTSRTELALDPAEIVEARWWTREELAHALATGHLGIAGRLSIARRLIERWYGGRLDQVHETGTVRAR